jgi:hypothetical protein
VPTDSFRRGNGYAGADFGQLAENRQIGVACKASRGRETGLGAGAPQKHPSLGVPDRNIATKPRQGLSGDSFQSARLLARRASGLNKPALDGDHGGVGPVGRAEFGENILDAALDAVFRNRKPCGDLFVPMSGCDQPQHIEFGRRQRITDGMLGKLVGRFR